MKFKQFHFRDSREFIFPKLIHKFWRMPGITIETRVLKFFKASLDHPTTVPCTSSLFHLLQICIAIGHRLHQPYTRYKYSELMGSSCFDVVFELDTLVFLSLSEIPVVTVKSIRRACCRSLGWKTSKLTPAAFTVGIRSFYLIHYITRKVV